jgi:thiamine transport system substrate-binding protein
MITHQTLTRAWLAALALLPVAAACGGDDAGDEPVTLTLLAYDSFLVADDAFDEFTEATGIEVEVALGGDAGELVSKAVLTSGNPEGDVLWGVDNTLLSRALEADVFEPYESSRLGELREELVALVPGREVTPVDFGDVCVNYDVAALEERGLEPPQGFDDLISPAYRDLLVVPSPATSSPGLAFLLATIAELGDPGWQDWWRSLRANGVMVVDGWSQAYYEAFTRAGGDRPLVVSYGSSPPAEVLFADPPLPEGAPAPTGVVPATCFRQVEFAGVLRGTEHPEQARLLVDYLVSPSFQAELPETLFVYPANRLVELPPTFAEHTVVPEQALTVDPSRIAANRQQWVDEWTTIVLR